jgi:Domain of unknown function (DUF4112)
MGLMTPARPRTMIIDQDGREIRGDELPRGNSWQGSSWQGSRQDSWQDSWQGSSSQSGPFAFQAFGVHLQPLTREQRLARLELLANLLDAAFVMPGTNIRYGLDGLIGLIPVVGDLITSAISLWIVREARALGAPWHIVARMLGNVALDGVIGIVPLAGDAFDVMFRANIRNMRLLRRWIDKQR